MNQVTKLFLSACTMSVFSFVLIYIALGKTIWEAYQFPFLIGVLSVILSLALWVQVIPKLKDLSFKLSIGRYKHFLMIAYIGLSLQLYELVGFYLTGFMLFVTIGLTFELGQLNRRNVFKTLWIGLVFMIIIYGLFALLLKVQTPGELL